jgi:hypothetical protein
MGLVEMQAGMDGLEEQKCWREGAQHCGSLPAPRET